MFSVLISAVPEVMQEFWYVYDLALLFVIAVLILVLMLFKRKSNLKEGQKSVKAALSSLKKAAASKTVTKTRFQLFTAKNLLNSAIFSFKACVNDEDMYFLGGKVNCISETLETLDSIIKKSGEQNISKAVFALIRNIETC